MHLEQPLTWKTLLSTLHILKLGANYNNKGLGIPHDKHGFWFRFTTVLGSPPS